MSEEDRLGKAEEHITELKESSARREEQMKTAIEKIDRLFKKQDEMMRIIKDANKGQNERIKGLEDYKGKIVFATKCVIWTTGVLMTAATFAVKVLPEFGIVLVD